MAIVTVSREIGSGGTYIALKVAQGLDGVCLDKEIMHEVAKKMDKRDETLVDFDQESYSRIGVFFQEALANIAQGGRVFHPFGIGPLDWEGVDMFSSYPTREYKQDEYIDVLRQVVNEMASKAGSVFLGRGTGQILKTMPGALHIRIIADENSRVKRLTSEQSIDEAAAKSLIAQKDEAARKFIYDFFGIDWSDPHHYHLCLNTSLIDPDECIRIILDQAGKPQSGHD